MATMPGCLTVMVSGEARSETGYAKRPRHARNVHQECHTSVTHGLVATSKVLEVLLGFALLKPALDVDDLVLTIKTMLCSYCRRNMARKHPNRRRPGLPAASAEAQEDDRLCHQQCYQVSSKLQEEGTIGTILSLV